ncbi:YhjD/YihY/BrkB family envelope integrity protein [Engelhardtia mirabilis]|uniref:Uncharacterized protein n=1 Tax=Engelhardtia mirabilis TaxID=2528011 RepID=A0A518BR57_9BACT|nr:ribonuclease BN/unknown domain fusion protein [Planctomycetes bacterium Pla133]QDV03756.1 ribonuclease BN/unknown domain fusion protein [Planctomycetes bacterium Pla86]
MPRETTERPDAAGESKDEPKRSPVERVIGFFTRDLWRRDWTEAPTLSALGVHLLRLVSIAGRGFVVHKDGFRAAGLTYYTVLSLVPFLAFAFSVAKGFGAYDLLINKVVEPMLESTFGEEPARGAGAMDLEAGESALVGPNGIELPGSAGQSGAGESQAQPSSPESAQVTGDSVSAAESELAALEDSMVASTQGTAAEGAAANGADASARAVTTSDVGAASGGTADLRRAIDQLLAFVEGTNVSSLGTLGLAIVLFTVVKLLSQVENALNEIWGVRRARTLTRKLSDFTSIVVVAPILAISVGSLGAASALGQGSEAEGVPSFLEQNLGRATELAMGLAPLASMWLFFSLLFLVLPNTRVRLRSAAIGGFCSAVLWVVAQRVYVGSQVGVASYNELYAGFAAIPLFLVWTWLSWMVVLLGAEFAYADQNHNAFGRRMLAGEPTPAEVEATGMRALVRITERFLEGGKPWTTEDLVVELMTPEEQLRDTLSRLADAGLLARTELGELEGWTCGRDPNQTHLLDARRALRGGDESGRNSAVTTATLLDARLRRALRGLDAASAELEANGTLADLVREVEEPRPE